MSALLTPEEIDALLHGFDEGDLAGTDAENPGIGRKAAPLASPGAKARQRVVPHPKRAAAGRAVTTGS